MRAAPGDIWGAMAADAARLSSGFATAVVASSRPLLRFADRVRSDPSIHPSQRTVWRVPDAATASRPDRNGLVHLTCFWRASRPWAGLQRAAAPIPALLSRLV